MMFGLFIGFQSSAKAQLTIENATDCTLFVAGTQLNANTAPPCDVCNAVALTRVLPSRSLIIPADAACGIEYWKKVFYTTAPSGVHVASTSNPSGLCGSDFGVLQCNNTNIEVNWSQTGAGAVVVTLK